MSRQFRLLTYNVHSCVGIDRRLSITRIAEVIAAAQPDIVALQELDVHRVRSDNVDQAHAIAERLEMKFHFHPAIQVAEEKYGDAIMSRFPMQLMRAAALPTISARRELQRRGALWVALEIDGRRVHVVNTHLGLSSRERVAQVRALLSAEWLGHAECPPPHLLCGDFNAVPGSPAYRILRRVLREAQRCGLGRRRWRTFSTRYPMLRLDHVFVSAGLTVRAVGVPRTALSRVASDHFPLAVDLELHEDHLAIGP